MNLPLSNHRLCLNTTPLVLMRPFNGHLPTKHFLKQYLPHPDVFKPNNEPPKKCSLFFVFCGVLVFLTAQPFAFANLPPPPLQTDQAANPPWGRGFAPHSVPGRRPSACHRRGLLLRHVLRLQLPGQWWPGCMASAARRASRVAVCALTAVHFELGFFFLRNFLGEKNLKNAQREW